MNGALLLVGPPSHAWFQLAWNCTTWKQLVVMLLLGALLWVDGDDPSTKMFCLGPSSSKAGPGLLPKTQVYIQEKSHIIWACDWWETICVSSSMQLHAPSWKGLPKSGSCYVFASSWQPINDKKQTKMLFTFVFGSWVRLYSCVSPRTRFWARPSASGTRCRDFWSRTCSRFQISWSCYRS